MDSNHRSSVSRPARPTAKRTVGLLVRIRAASRVKPLVRRGSRRAKSVTGQSTLPLRFGGELGRVFANGLRVISVDRRRRT
jgi:hypothetical protein